MKAEKSCSLWTAIYKYVILTPRGKDEEKKTRVPHASTLKETSSTRKKHSHPSNVPVGTYLGQTLEACDWWLPSVSSDTLNDGKEFPKRFCGNGLRDWVIPLRSGHNVTSHAKFLFLLFIISVLAFSPSKFAF